MPTILDVMNIALRVVNAVAQKCDPDSNDLEALRTFLPRLANAPLDELACGVIQEALNRRSQIRQAKANSD